jgi:hypothetical protein
VEAPPPLLIGGSEKRWKWETIQNLLAGRVYFIGGDDFIKSVYTIAQGSAEEPAKRVPIRSR